MLGVLFDVNSGLSRTASGRGAVRFWLDIWFGLLAALITFYVSLAIMDGQLHPLLFGGSATGFWLEHVSVGKFVSMVTRRICSFWCRSRRCLITAMEGAWMAFWSEFGALKHRITCFIAVKKDENGKSNEKTRKKYTFFQKKS